MVLMTVVVALLGLDDQASAQASKPGTPTTVSPVVREEIDRLASDDVGRRATAANALGKMGAAAEPAIAWLIAAMSDERETLSPEYGIAPVNLVAGKALSKIGLSARKEVTSLLTSPGTTPLMRRNAVRALTVMRDQASLDVILESLPYAYSDADPTGWFADKLEDVLPCFLPDPRVPEAMLRLAQSGQHAHPEQWDSGTVHNRVQWFHQWFQRAVKGLPDSVGTLGEVQDWWARHKTTASLSPAGTDGPCRQ
jgi:hypothetical protein